MVWQHVPQSLKKWQSQCHVPESNVVVWVSFSPRKDASKRINCIRSGSWAYCLALAIFPIMLECMGIPRFLRCRALGLARYTRRTMSAATCERQERQPACERLVDRPHGIDRSWPSPSSRDTNAPLLTTKMQLRSHRLLSRITSAAIRPFCCQMHATMPIANVVQCVLQGRQRRRKVLLSAPLQ